MENVYYSPEKFGLEILGELKDPEAIDGFNTLIVLRGLETGRLFWATDAGCSCPGPFEDYTSIDTLAKITDDTWSDFQQTVALHAVGALSAEKLSAPSFQSLACDKTQLLSKVARLLLESHV